MNKQELEKLGKIIGQNSALYMYARQSNCKHNFEFGAQDGHAFVRCTKCGKDQPKERLSACCGAEISEIGFCKECLEHA